MVLENWAGDYLELISRMAVKRLSEWNLLKDRKETEGIATLSSME